MQGVDSYPCHLRQFLLYSNVHIPFLASILVCSSAIYLDQEISFALLFVASAGAFLVYQIDRVWLLSPEDLINQPDRVDWYVRNHSYKYVSTLLAVMTGGVALFYLSPSTLQSGLLLGVVGIVYLVPLGKKLKRLKGYLLVKPAFIAFCWTFGVVILPVVEAQGSINRMVWLFFLYRCLLIIANVLLADLPDKVGDERASLTTFAVRLKNKSLIQIVLFLAGIAFVVGFIQGVIYQWPFFLFIDLIGPLLLMALAYFSFHRNLSESHLLLSFVNDLVIGWPIISLICYYSFTAGL